MIHVTRGVRYYGQGCKNSLRRFTGLPHRRKRIARAFVHEHMNDHILGTYRDMSSQYLDKVLMTSESVHCVRGFRQTVLHAPWRGDD